MRAVCLALFLANITFSAGCIPIGGSGLGKKAESEKVAVEEPEKENAVVPENEPAPMAGNEKPAVEATPKEEMKKLSKEDAEKVARAHFDQEMQKWMTGEISSATSIRFIQGRPLKYEILSVIFDPKVGLPADVPPDDRIAFRLNASVTFESGAGTPIEKVINYQVSLWDDGTVRLSPTYE